MDQLPTFREIQTTGGGIQARYFGISTLLLTDGRTTILVDGFFTRPGLGRLVLGYFGLPTLEPDEDLVRGLLNKHGIGRVDAVLTAHSHHDHAMDSGVVAAATKATLYGSRSSINVALGPVREKVEFKVIPTIGETTLKIGEFVIHARNQPHAKTPFNFKGPVETPLETPAGLRDYKSDANFSFWIRHPAGCLLIVPSADDRKYVFDGVRADVVFLGIGGLGKRNDKEIENFWKKIVAPTGARFVVPIHWDSFARPLAQGLAPLPPIADNLENSMAIMQRMAGNTVKIVPMRLADTENLPTRPGATCH